MDRSGSEYAQSDQASSAQYTPQTDVRSATLSNSNTPQSDYGLNPPSARSGGFPDYIPRQAQYHHAPSSTPGSVASMAQPSPSTIPQNGHNHNPHDEKHMKSDHRLPIDPSIAQNSPTYPPPYSPYNAQAPHDMSQYQGHPQPGMYRPEWAQYGHQHSMPGPYGGPPTTMSSAQPAVSAGQNRPGQLYSFVSIPGAQQNKRPRRRYEEIERMYKCGWNGCEKAYGTLNHLNAHVTMQSHGTKRTPEEFKEIRKEWKARKKEEESQRKAQEERDRAAQQANQQVDGQAPDPTQQGQAPQYPGNVRPQLPPIGYQAAEGQVPGQYAGQQQGMVYTQGNGQMAYPANYPHSPYGQAGQVYQQQHQYSS